MDKDYKIILKGPYYKKNIITKFEKNNKDWFTNEEHIEIDKKWTELRKKSKKEGKILHDGKLLKLISYSSGDKLKIYTKSTNYKYYAVGIKIDEKELRKKLEKYFPFSISGLIKTSDDYLVLAERSSLSFMDQGKIHLIPAGHPEYDLENIKKSQIDLFGEILKETKEETGISNSEINEITILGIIQNFKPLKPEIIFFISTKLKKEEIIISFDKSSDKWEHKKIIFLKATTEKILNFVSIQRDKKLSILIGALELYLQTRKK